MRTGLCSCLGFLRGSGQPALRIPSWNVNGLNQTKLGVYETADYNQSFDLALLTETRCEESDVFRGYSKLSLPPVNSGAAGEVTCVLVHPRLQGSASLWKLQPEAQAVWE